MTTSNFMLSLAALMARKPKGSNPEEIDLAIRYPSNPAIAGTLRFMRSSWNATSLELANPCVYCSVLLLMMGKELGVVGVPRVCERWSPARMTMSSEQTPLRDAGSDELEEQETSPAQPGDAPLIQAFLPGDGAHQLYEISEPLPKCSCRGLFSSCYCFCRSA
jgi:hypothetical protein